jgi:hypothetical protein
MHPRAGLEIRRRVPWFECVRWQGAASPPSRDDAAGHGFAEAQPRFQLAVVVTDVRGRRAGLRRSAVDQTIRLTATLSFRRFSGARDHGWIAARAAMVDCRSGQSPKPASRQSLRGSRPTSATDDPHAIVMMHFVYEIRVTLSTKKSMRSGRDGWRRSRLAPQPRPRTEVSCQLPFITRTWRDSRN